MENEILLHVEGMRGKKCEDRITRRIAKMPGIEMIQVNAEKGTVSAEVHFRIAGSYVYDTDLQKITDIASCDCTVVEYYSKGSEVCPQDSSFSQFKTGGEFSEDGQSLTFSVSFNAELGTDGSEPAGWRCAGGFTLPVNS